MRNGSLRSNVVSFCDRSNFSMKYLNRFRDHSWGLEYKHLKARNLCDEGGFSSIILSQHRRPIEFKFSQVCYFMHTPSETTGRWQLPKVTSASFKFSSYVNICFMVHREPGHHSGSIGPSSAMASLNNNNTIYPTAPFHKVAKALIEWQGGIK